MCPQLSPIDHLFNEIYGYYPTKAGTAYEILVCSALKLLSEKSTLLHNQQLDSRFSEGETYQIDGVMDFDQERTLIEAKDHTIQSKRVGRPEIQTFAGALLDIHCDGGIFSSATDFTNPAKKYSSSSMRNPDSKSIETIHVRPIEETDKEGRIEKLIIKLISVHPDQRSHKVVPIFTEEGQKLLDTKFSGTGPISLIITNLYDRNGSSLQTVPELVNSLTFDLTGAQTEVKGQWSFEDAYILLNKDLIGVKALEYEFQLIVKTHQIEITPKGEAKLLFKNSDGSIDTLITDEDLKAVSLINNQLYIQKDK